MTAGDWSAVRDIYLEGIATGDATFGNGGSPEWDRWDAGHLRCTAAWWRAVKAKYWDGRR